MCHLHPLHLLFYIINNYNKAIVLFNNFCAIQPGLPSRAIRACECFHNGIVCEPSVLEVKGTEKKLKSFTGSGRLWSGRRKKKKKKNEFTAFCLHCSNELFRESF
jgi:hypothetical protein